MAKQTKNKANFTTIRVEGAILPIDLLERIAKNEKGIEGLKEEDYHLSGETIKDAISQSWNRLRASWANFQNLKAKLPTNEPGTTITREKWLSPLFQQLGYGRLNPTKQSFDIEGKSYPISHLWQQVPMHLVGCNVELDKRTAKVAGASQASPHSLVQELLNRAEDYLWAFVSNGSKFRILRDNVSLTRQAYVEFDLEAMMQGEVYSDFVLFWLLCNQSRVEAEKGEEFWLEKWSKTAQELGTRLLKKLRAGVENAISKLGSGFLAHSNNKVLRTKLQTGKLNAQDYYRQLLRLVYRLLFLFVAEDRDLLLDPNASQTVKDYYNKYYSTAKIRKLAGRRKGSKHSDLWQGLSIVMHKLGNGGCSELALPALGSFLFSNRSLPDLDGCLIDNQALLEAFKALAYTEDPHSRRPVDYKNLRSEELGSVYESLLELHPIINTHVDVATFELQNVAGNERKTTGSYYTPDSLVQCLLDSALDPVLEEAIKDLDSQKAEEAILNLKVCDPACGSGHFLVAAAHRMAKRLASIRTGDSEPSPTETQKALRDVIGHCIYGVDINEMAVELCKVALWMEAIEPGKPLSFLEHHIQCGNSLLGTTPALMAGGIPDEAFNPIEGDDKKKAAALKKQNKKEREGRQGSMFAQFEGGNELDSVDLLAKIREIDLVDDSSISGIRRKQELYEQFLMSDYKQAKVIADAWCAAFVWKKTAEAPLAVTHDIFWLLKNKPQGVPPSTLAEIQRLATQYKFFHWHLAFPSVFRMDIAIAENKQTGWSGGFDVVLGNPPWERIKIQEREWFANKYPNIANASNASIRNSLIEELQSKDTFTYISFIEDQRKTGGEGNFIENSKSYPLGASGDTNTYPLFIELSTKTISVKGRIGLIVKTGILADYSMRNFFADLIQSKQIVSAYDFSNKHLIFPAVVANERFTLLTLAGKNKPVDKSTISILNESIDYLKKTNNSWQISADDIKLINPNTLTCPLFQCPKDVTIVQKIYQRLSILIEESYGVEKNLWGCSYYTMFHMTNDSYLFKDLETLQLNNHLAPSPDWYSNQQRYLALLEGKLFDLYDHRHGTFLGIEPTKRFGIKAEPNHPDEKQRNDPYFYCIPRYWVLDEEIRKRYIEKLGYIPSGILTFRDVCRTHTDLRTVRACISPTYGAGNKAPMLLFPATSIAEHAKKSILLCTNLTAFVLDYVARQKFAGGSLNKYILIQLPFIQPNNAKCFWEDTTISNWLIIRAIELTYTAWDLEAFAKDCGYFGPPFKWNEERRFLIRAELDAAYFHLYGIARDDVDYIMETFPIFKRKDEQKYGEYRTKRVILEVYDAMAEAMKTGIAYQTIVSPPPADPSVAHPPRETASTPLLEIRGYIFPFLRRPDIPQEDKYKTSVPLYTLKAAAGGFGESQSVEPDGWAELKTTHKLREGMFVAQVVGRSMEPMIPDGAYCLFASPVTGSRQGRIVLVEHHSITDEETSASYTVKRYHSSKEIDEQGNWQHSEIRLEPLNPDFKPIILRGIAEDELRVVAEVVEVLK